MNKIILVLVALFKAATQYLILKNQSFIYDIELKSKARQEAIIKQIEKLRSSGTSSDADAADVLRSKLLQEQRFFEHISAEHYHFDGECSDKNESRDIHASN